MLNPWEKFTLLHIVGKLETTTPCNACLHFKQGYCRRWEDNIPADTLSDGCQEWEFFEGSCPF